MDFEVDYYQVGYNWSGQAINEGFCYLRIPAEISRINEENTSSADSGWRGRLQVRNLKQQSMRKQNNCSTLCLHK